MFVALKGSFANMIIIGEKINGAIPSIREAIAQRNETLILERTLAQANAGANFLDCAPSTATDIEYETMVWLIGLMQSVTQVPLCIDSPNAKLLARILEEGHVARPGMVNSVNEEPAQDVEIDDTQDVSEDKK